MNHLGPNFYLPVVTEEDHQKTLIFLPAEAEETVARAFGIYDKLSALSSAEKVETFMFGTYPQQSDRSGRIRPLTTTPPPMHTPLEKDGYYDWLRGKSILRTERFFSKTPTWNFASTRHALLGNFQFKGLGFVGVNARIDYEHTNGRLTIYDGLYETVITWMLHRGSHACQKVVAIWAEGALVVLLREASSYRLAQIEHVDLSPYVNRILEQHRCAGADVLVHQSVTRYAALFLDSWELMSPTMDNLMLDGSIIDAAGMRNHGRTGWTIPVYLRPETDGSFSLVSHPFTNWQKCIRSSALASKNVGATIDGSRAEEIFWETLAKCIPAQVRQLKAFFVDLFAVQERKEKYKLDEWVQLLGRACPWARITIRKRIGPRLVNLDEDNILVAIESDLFSSWPCPYQITDQLILSLQADPAPIPAEFASAIIRSVAPLKTPAQA